MSKFDLLAIYQLFVARLGLMNTSGQLRPITFLVLLGKTPLEKAEEEEGESPIIY